MLEETITKLEPVNLPEAPTECGHKDWQMGCERCWWEVRGLANDTIRVSTAEAQIEGAILFNWHVLLTLQGMEQQIAPMMRGIDLKEVELARNIIANLQQITVYLVRLVADPRKLGAALTNAALIARDMASRSPEPRAEAPTSSVVLTDTEGK